VKHAYSLSPRDPKVERLAEELDTLSDEQFYQRLQELKSDHQQTLKMCEQAYNSKVCVLCDQQLHAPCAATELYESLPFSRPLRKHR